MNKYNTPRRDFPENLKCIWMESNIVSYKLCDRNYDCEDCQFDQVMRNRCLDTKPHQESLIPDIIINQIITKINDEYFNEKYIFLENQLVMKHIFDNTYYLGINPLIIILLDNINQIFWNDNGGFLSKDETLLTISGDWGEKEFKVPMPVLLFDRISKFPNELLLKKWFAVVGITQDEGTLPALSSLQLIEEKLKIIKLLSKVKNYNPEIGYSMNDGGERIKFLYQIIGKERYKRVIS